MNRREVIARLAEIIREVAIGASPAVTAKALTALAATMGGAPQLALVTDDGAPVVPDDTDDTDDGDERAASADAILRVFQHWQRATGKRRARLLPVRSAKIRSRLREFTEVELCAAIDGALTSDFHRGENDQGTEYLDLRTIFKNGEVVEGFIERAGGVTNAPPLDDSPKAERVRELRIAAGEAMKEGRTDEYNAYNAELRKLREDG